MNTQKAALEMLRSIVESTPIPGIPIVAKDVYYQLVINFQYANTGNCYAVVPGRLTSDRIAGFGFQNTYCSLHPADRRNDPRELWLEWQSTYIHYAKSGDLERRIEQLARWLTYTESSHE